jgi:hypothetical protein
MFLLQQPADIYHKDTHSRAVLELPVLIFEREERVEMDFSLEN